MANAPQDEEKDEPKIAKTEEPPQEIEDAPRDFVAVSDGIFTGNDLKTQDKRLEELNGGMSVGKYAGISGTNTTELNEEENKRKKEAEAAIDAIEAQITALQYELEELYVQHAEITDRLTKIAVQIKVEERKVQKSEALEQKKLEVKTEINETTEQKEKKERQINELKQRQQEIEEKLVPVEQEADEKYNLEEKIFEKIENATGIILDSTMLIVTKPLIGGVELLGIDNNQYFAVHGNAKEGYYYLDTQERKIAVDPSDIQNQLAEGKVSFENASPRIQKITRERKELQKQLQEIGRETNESYDIVFDLQDQSDKINPQIEKAKQELEEIKEKQLKQQTRLEEIEKEIEELAPSKERLLELKQEQEILNKELIQLNQQIHDKNQELQSLKEQVKAAKKQEEDLSRPAPKPDEGAKTIAEHKNEIANIIAQKQGISMDELKELATEYNIPESHMTQLQNALEAMNFKFDYERGTITSNDIRVGPKEGTPILKEHIAPSAAHRFDKNNPKENSIAFNNVAAKPQELDAPQPKYELDNTLDNGMNA